jgi:ATP-dependent DNA helicase DinG
LPGYKHLVIDEAHHLEEVASRHLGADLHYASLANTLMWLYKDARNGLLTAVEQRLQHESEPVSEKWIAEIEKLYPRIVRAKEEWDKLTELLFALVAEQNEANGSESGQFVMRVKPEQLPSAWDALLVTEDNIFLEINEVVKQTEKMIAELKEQSDEWTSSSLLTDLSGTVKQLARNRDVLRFFMRMQDESYVYWIEASPLYKAKSVQLFAAPLDVSKLLRDLFFKDKESIVLTSATLTVNKSFHYSASQLGLDDLEITEKLKTLQLSSPFKYREQALVLIPRDFPSVKGTAEGAFLEALADSLADVARQTKGRMLVLFTSYRMLRQIHPELKNRLKPHGIQVLGQGVDSGNRSRLVGLFRSRPESVLLGTNSFWEGVDIPGEALTCLAIVRLPFQPPNHPVVEAKSELLKKNKQNPFTALSVPQAVIRFKQGFGRLVRTASDKGVVVIYDTRVLETSYGRNFLYSLPGPKIEHLHSKHLVARISEWLGG